MPRQNRKKEILTALLKILASSRSSHVSTAQLALEIGISEAALWVKWTHQASKSASIEHVCSAATSTTIVITTIVTVRAT